MVTTVQREIQQQLWKYFHFAIYHGEEFDSRMHVWIAVAYIHAAKKSGIALFFSFPHIFILCLALL